MKGAVIGIAGCSQDGIAAVGDTLIGALALEGYFAILSTQNDEPTIGGGASCRIRLGATPVLNSGGVLDLAVVLDWKKFLSQSGELALGPETMVVHDRKAGPGADGLPPRMASPAAIMSVPISEMAIRSGGSSLAKDSVVLGLLASWLGLSKRRILLGISSRNRSKEKTAHTAVKAAFSAGVDFAAQHPLPRNLRLGARQARGVGRRIADGNEMCARAALFAGCKFFAAYPIAPAGGITDFLQREIWRHGGSFLAAEDEIAAAAAAVGASFAGVKSMTATSGPGLSLQAEVLGLTSAVELPLVCINVQRGGPATGMPTTQEQADLFAAVFSANGDNVRPVLAPTRSMSRSRRSISPSTTKPP